MCKLPDKTVTNMADLLGGMSLDSNILFSNSWTFKNGYHGGFCFLKNEGHVRNDVFIGIRSSNIEICSCTESSIRYHCI